MEIFIAFDEGERYLITWFFPAGLIMSRGYRSRCQSISGFGRHLGRAHLASIPFVTLHGISGNKVNARTRHDITRSHDSDTTRLTCGYAKKNNSMFVAFVGIVITR